MSDTKTDIEKVENYIRQVYDLKDQAPEVHSQICQEVVNMISHGLFLITRHYEALTGEHKKIEI